MSSQPSRRLRVLVTTSWVPGGLTTWTHEFSNHLADRGYDVTCAHVKADWVLRRDPPPFRNVTYKTIRLQASPTNYFAVVPRFLLSHSEPFDVVISTEAEGTRIPRKCNGQTFPHVAAVLVPDPEYVDPFDLLLPTLASGTDFLRSRFSGSRNDVSDRRLTAYWRWVNYLGRKRVGRASVAVCISRFLGNAIHRFWKIRPEKIRVIYPGVDTDAFHGATDGSTAKTCRLLFVGGSNPRKGVDVVVEAFARVHERHPEVSLDLIGGWDWRPQQLMAARFGVSSQVRFLPYVPHEDMPTWLRRSFAFLAPTRAESFGIALAEAMACGVPVVSTPMGAVPELIDDRVNGILVPANDPRALAEATLELLDNPRKAEEIGQAGRRRVEQDFAWDVVMPFWEELLEQLARKRG